VEPWGQRNRRALFIALVIAPLAATVLAGCGTASAASPNSDRYEHHRYGKLTLKQPPRASTLPTCPSVFKPGHAFPRDYAGCRLEKAVLRPGLLACGDRVFVTTYFGWGYLGETLHLEHPDTSPAYPKAISHCSQIS
jgi:hypothetical protein